MCIQLFTVFSIIKNIPESTNKTESQSNKELFDNAKRVSRSAEQKWFYHCNLAQRNKRSETTNMEKETSCGTSHHTKGCGNKHKKVPPFSQKPTLPKSNPLQKIFNQNTSLAARVMSKPQNQTATKLKKTKQNLTAVRKGTVTARNQTVEGTLQ